MPYKKPIKLCLLAKARLQKCISAMTMAKQLRGPNAPDPLKKKEKEPSDKERESKGKKKEENHKAPKKDGAAVKSKWLKLPDKIKNLTTEQNEALTNVCY